MAVPTKTLSASKFQIATYSVDFLVIVFYCILCMLFQKNLKTGGMEARRRGGWGHENSRGRYIKEMKEHEKIPGVNWKRSGVSRGDQLIKKKLCVISIGLSFWPCWNFQAKERVYHNFAEFPGMNPFFLWNSQFPKVKWQT